MIGILFTGFSSFSQSIHSLNPERSKDAAYINAHQNRIANTDVSLISKSSASGLSATSTAPANIQKADPVNMPEDANTLRGGVINDNCNGATLLTVGATCNPVTGTVIGAGQSLPAISCNAFTGNANDDVWYRFVATNSSADISVQGDASFDAVIEFLTGTCGAQTSVGCADETVNGGEEVISITGMTVGTTYYIRVYDYDADVPATPTFTICVVSAPAGSTHDDCLSAITLSVGEGECNPTNGSVTNATASANPLCANDNGATADDDVWYNFIASNDTVLIDVLGGEGFDAVVEIFYGTDCNNLTSMGCIDGTLDGELESVVVTGLIPGETIWIRVYDWFSGVPTGTDFTICVFNPCSISIPNGATPEAETCGADLNGGCLMVTPAYQSISCNETVTGTLWADTAKRDFDWYQFTVTANTTATFTAAAELPFAIGILNISNCASPVILTNNAALLDGSPCSSINVSTALTPGTYAAVITVYDFDYYVCSANLYNQYWATLSMTTTTPTITAGGTTTFCQGGSVQLTSSSATSNTWTPGGATTQAITASTGGSYTVSVPDPNGCGPQTSAPTVVTANSLPATPTITANGPLTFCDPGSVDLTSSSATGNVWTPGGATTQTITANADGSYSVTVTDGNGCVSAASAATVVDEEICIGVNEVAMVNSLNIFPNPASESLNIEFTATEAICLEVRMTNTMGQLVYSDVKTTFSGTYKNTFSVSGFAIGNYNLQVITDKEMMNKKVIIK
jgi:predicted RNase H-like HicB family nuclease